MLEDDDIEYIQGNANVSVDLDSSISNSTRSPTSTSGTLTPETSDYEASIDSQPNTPTNTPTEEQDERYSLNPMQLKQAIQTISYNLQEFNEEHPARPRQRNETKDRYSNNLERFNEEFPEVRKSIRLAKKPVKTYTEGTRQRKK